MKGKCRIEVEFDSGADAKAAHDSLKQEEEFKKRSNSKVTASGSLLAVDIEGDDVVALRATANSYLRALQAMESVNRCGNNDDK